MKKLLTALFIIEFALIFAIIALYSIDNKAIPTAYFIKENKSTTNFKLFTKAVCEEKSEHIICQDKLFVECNGNEYIVNEDNLNNYAECNGLKLNLSDTKVTGYVIFNKNIDIKEK